MPFLCQNLASSTLEQAHSRKKIINLIWFTGRTKQSDLATARAFVGTCMDMCPEKERYDREDKRRLSQYEIEPGTETTVSHCEYILLYSAPKFPVYLASVAILPKAIN